MELGDEQVDSSQTFLLDRECHDIVNGCQTAYEQLNLALKAKVKQQ